MSNPIFRYFTVVCLFFLAVSFNENIVFGENNSYHNYSPLSVKIKLKKKVYHVAEPMEGEVVIENDYPASLPAVFIVELFHNKKAVSHRTTSIPQIPSGVTEFTFKSFGIPAFNHSPESKGDWRIHIVQQNLDPRYYSGDTIVRVVPVHKTLRKIPPVAQ